MTQCAQEAQRSAAAWAHALPTAAAAFRLQLAIQSVNVPVVQAHVRDHPCVLDAVRTARPLRHISRHTLVTPTRTSMWSPSPLSAVTTCPSCQTCLPTAHHCCLPVQASHHTSRRTSAHLSRVSLTESQAPFGVGERKSNVFTRAEFMWPAHTVTYQWPS
jgi:hypothetical protein